MDSYLEQIILNLVDVCDVHRVVDDVLYVSVPREIESRTAIVHASGSGSN